MNGLDPAVLVKGFALSFGLIVAIGPQNALVLRQGLRRRHVLAVTSVCFASDSFLIAVGVAGAGTVFALNPVLERVMTWVGITFITGYGLFSFRAAFKPQAITPADMEAAARTSAGRGLKAAVVTALAFTYLNPHVYVDTMVLIGGVSAQYPAGDKLAFLVGAVCASAVWFYGLGFGARTLAPLFEKPAAWRVLDVGVGLIMLAIAGTLAAGRLMHS